MAKFTERGKIMETALYLIPVTLGETEINQVIPSYNHNIITEIKCNLYLINVVINSFAIK